MSTDDDEAGDSRLSVEAPAFDTIAPRRVHYVLPGLPRGMLSLIGGNAGLGKSLLTARQAADVTRLDPLAGVLLLLAEDAPAEVTRPRLEAHGADLARVRLLRLSQDGEEVGIVLPDHLPHVREVARAHAIRFVVVDPVNSYLPSRVDYARDPDVRSVLVPLARLAAELELAIVLVAHLNKSQVSEALHRIGGSVAYGAVIRSAWILDRDPDDPDGEQGRQRVLVHAKCNVGPLLPSSVCRVEPTTTTSGFDTAKLVHVGDSPYGAAELLERNAGRGPSTSKLETATSLLSTLLADHEWHRAAEVRETLEAAGLSRSTIDRARTQLSVSTQMRGFPSEGYWCLPGDPSSSSDNSDEEDERSRSTEPNLHPPHQDGQMRRMDADSLAHNVFLMPREPLR